MGFLEAFEQGVKLQKEYLSKIKTVNKLHPLMSVIVPAH